MGVCSAHRRRWRAVASALGLAPALAGCVGVLNPVGPVGRDDANILIVATVIMLAVVVPTILLAFWMAWRYRASNTKAEYLPEWSYSGRIEAIVWSIPILVIMFLGGVIWIGSYKLDPFRPLPSKAPPLEVQVVALDWKWLFIYPELGVATVNEMAAPVDRPIAFKITASSVMNSFYVPALAGQVYAMPGMQTQLHAVVNKPGVYDGFSANYSGAGFSGMRFKFKGLSQADFDRWVADAKAAGPQLTRADYLQLEKPSENEPVRRYAGVDPNLFLDVVNRCTAPGQVCKDRMTHTAEADAAVVAQTKTPQCADPRAAGRPAL